ncbi:GGDEF domain-containing protein [Marinobacter salinus]|uniref:diguanylate cyclase n=1 Tax=Marinobacter salinus TaxID=1874317 RepID=A0A1D9GS00_9GAMM|nr:GGDEF domain-containing protein [Marinobacter salinus]AOY90291.1 GGDEF domain-containing protein [Marinobacter salinus]
MESYSEAQKHLARPYRKAVLRSLLAFTFGAGLLFFFLNLKNQNYPLAYAELGMAVYSAFIFRAISDTAHLERWILAFTLPFFTTMMFALISPRATSTVYAWVLLIPILSHLLMGRRLGLLISAFYMITAAVIFFFMHRNMPEMMQPLPIANMGIMSLTILAFSHIYEITREQSESRLLKMAQTDALTGLANRARLSDVFSSERKRSLRQGTPLSVLLLDLDHFKQVNDQHGHEAGDQALKHVSSILRDALRATDLATRLGGEEFALLLSDTSAEQALTVADKIRSNIETSPFHHQGQPINLTVSGGIAQFGPDGGDLRTLISRADQSLYHAKDTGRNTIVIAGTVPAPA